MAFPQVPVPSPIQKTLDETKVDYVRLGSSGLRVSVPMLGCMGFGVRDWTPMPSAPWTINEEEAHKVLKATYDSGINTWVTANMYSNGESEEIVGRAIKKFNIPREKLVILSKVSQYVAEEREIFAPLLSNKLVKSKDYVNRGGLSRVAIFSAVDASLKRLGTSYLDVLSIHRFDPDTPIEETMEALHDLVKSGKVRYIGASSMLATRFARMQFVAEKNGWTKFIVMENSWHLCYREEEREMVNFCNETGVGLTPYGALYGGILSHPLGWNESDRAKLSALNRLTPADEEIVKRVEEVANKKGWKMGQVALLWLRAKGAIPLVGLNSVARVEETWELRGKKLTEEEVNYLEEPYVAKSLAPGTQ